MNAPLLEPAQPPLRILCWIMTAPSSDSSKAKAVKATWGKHCDTLLFMSTQEGNIQISLI